MEVDNKKNDENIIPNDADKPQKGVNVPNLRFPCFYSTWCKNKFKNLFVLLKNNTLSRAELNYNKGKIKNIHYGDILIKFNNFVLSNANSIPYINDESIPNKYSELLLKNGDLIIADTAEDYSVGKATELIFNDKSLIISGLHTIPCRPVQNIFASKYLGYYINSPSYHNQLLPLIQGIKVSSISKSQIVNTYITYPDIKEQNKIAKFLTLIEQRIDTQSKIIEDLQTLKISICDKVFEDTTYPEYKLKDVLSERIEKSNVNNQYEILSSTIKGLFTQKEYFDKDIASSNNIGYKIVHLYDIIISPQNLWMGNITFNQRFTNGLVSPSYKIYIINNNFDMYYIANMLKTKRAMYKYICSSQQGASVVRRNLNMDDFLSLSFNIPDINKQRKIGLLLNTIDKRIDLEQTYLTKLNQQKKFLLKNMFI